MRMRPGRGKCGVGGVVIRAAEPTGRKFKPFLKDVRGRVAETRRDHDATTAPVLAFWCNKGRHRSVASGSLARACLVRAGYQVWSFLHLAKDTWHRGTCGGDGCPECSGGSALREKLFEEAYECWRRR